MKGGESEWASGCVVSEGRVVGSISISNVKEAWIGQRESCKGCKVDQ